MVETLSIAVIGAPGVGKTSIIRQFVYNDFSEVYTPTRTRFVYRPSVILNGNMYELKILDVPPMTSFPSSSSQVNMFNRVPKVCWGSPGLLSLCDPDPSCARAVMFRYVSSQWLLLLQNNTPVLFIPLSQSDVSGLLVAMET